MKEECDAEHPAERMLRVNRIMKFGMIGAIGFVIEAVILTILYREHGVNVLLARIMSFSAATLATWLLNRSFTFRETLADRPKHKEYSLYMAIQIGGASLNFLVFILLIMLFPTLGTIPVVPLAVGALFGFLFNYMGLRHWVYCQRGTNG